MFKQADESEKVYRIVDAIYRLHRDLFEIENVLLRSSRLQLRLARISINGRMGTMVAGLLVLVPILISLGDIKWGSAPAITIYLIAGSVAILWIYQVISAGNVDREIFSLESCAPTDVLDTRIDFVLEEVNACVVRYKLVEGIIKELKEVEESEIDAKTKQVAQEKRMRYEEILQSCLEYITDLIAASEKLVKEKKRLKKDHDAVLDWAAAIPTFARRK